MKAPFWLILALLGSALALSFADDNVRIEKNVPYLGPDRQEKGDLYLPANVKPGQRFPAVVIIHGGGWVGGKKNAPREINIGTNLVLSGYVGFSIDYVLAKTNSPTWPQNLYDCKTAVRWLRKNAGRLHIDPDHIGAIGGSAGGHLATMLAVAGPDAGLDPKEPYGEYSCQIQAAVDLYGPADLMTWPPRDSTPMMPAKRSERPDLYKQATPATHADKNDPPILILHGTKDGTVPLDQSEKLAEALKKAGVVTELVIVEDGPHSFHLQPKQRDLRPLVIGFF
ncbi:MAG: alpha/beta hydrolase, partial [Verrucomicrobia bacterium]|nr:alpha/beta hydrolase [Verrucomicrobiota bacterium]